MPTPKPQPPKAPVKLQKKIFKTQPHLTQRPFQDNPALAALGTKKERKQ